MKIPGSDINYIVKCIYLTDMVVRVYARFYTLAMMTSIRSVRETCRKVSKLDDSVNEVT